MVSQTLQRERSALCYRQAETWCLIVCYRCIIVWVSAQIFLPMPRTLNGYSAGRNQPRNCFDRIVESNLISLDSVACP